MLEYDLESEQSLETIKGRNTPKSYSLPYYDRATIEGIEQKLAKNWYRKRDTILEHLACLDSIAKKLSLVSVVERQNRVVDSELQKERQRIQGLIAKLEKLLTTKPKIRIYRSM